MSGDLKAKIAGGGLVALLLVAGVNAWVESKVDAEVSLRANKALTAQQEQTVSSLVQHTKDLEAVYRVRMDLEKGLRNAELCLVMSSMTAIFGCSHPAPQPAVITPPRVLLEPCAEPQNSGATLELLKAGDTEGAALAHVRYAIAVREAMALCNSRLSAIRLYYDGMEEVLRE